MPSTESEAVLTVLGSGTLVPDASRASPAHLLSLGSGARILLDCGAGTVHGLARHGVPWQALTHVAITHFHTDHVGDLAALLLAFRRGLPEARTEPLTLLGPRGFVDFLGRLAEAFGAHVLDPGFEVRVVELEPAHPFEAGEAGFTLSCHPTPHTSESVAYRVEGPWGAVGYTGDTGPSSEVAEFLARCDVVVAECTVPDSEAGDTHLYPRAIGSLARCARPRVLVVVHVGPLMSPEEAVEAVGVNTVEALVPGRDGLRVVIGPDGPAVDPKTAAI